MSLNHKILYNTFIQIVGRAAAVVCSVITLGIIFRSLGVVGFGQYTTAVVFLQLVSVFADLGLGMSMTQMLSTLSGKDEEELASNIFTLRVFSMLAGVVLAIIVGIFLPYSTGVKQAIAVVAIAFLFNSLSQVLGGIYQKYLAMNRYALAEVVNRLVVLAAVAVAAYLRGGLLGVVISSVAGAFAGFMLDYIWVRQYVKISWQISLAVWQKIWRQSWPIGLSMVVTMIYFKIDTLIVQWFWGDEATGLYGAPYRVLEILIQLPYIFLGLLLPILTRHWQSLRREEFNKFFQVGFDGIIFLSVPLVIGGYFLASSIMIITAGPAFAASGAIFQVLLLAMFFIFVAAVFTHVILAINRQRQMLLVFGLVAICSLLAYFVFIPRFSYWGAAWTTVVSEGLVMILSGFLVYRETRFVPRITSLLQAGFAGVVMAVWLVAVASWPWYGLIVSGGVIYLAVLYAVGGLQRLKLNEAQ